MSRSRSLPATPAAGRYVYSVHLKPVTGVKNLACAATVSMAVGLGALSVGGGGAAVAVVVPGDDSLAAFSAAAASSSNIILQV